MKFVGKTLLAVACLCGVAAALYALWSPGAIETSGVHDHKANAIWLGHGWIGSDDWFAAYRKSPGPFRDPEKIEALAHKLKKHHIRDVYPHLCPSAPDGRIPAVDPVQTSRFLDHFEGFRVMPWIGGRLNVHCFLDPDAWKANFRDSVLELLAAHPRLAGVHVNIEPMPSGNEDFVDLLKMMRQALPRDKALSVAAYPPTSMLHPVISLHWGKEYYQAVSANVDQLAVMLYDSAAPMPKIYEHMVRSWTRDILSWVEDSEVVLGVPVYEDTGVLVHSHRVENLETGLKGVHAGLRDAAGKQSAYRGVAIYSEWEMDDAEWEYLRRHFNSP